MVARDSVGDVMFAACRPLAGCEDAEEAEAHAALLGIEKLIYCGTCIQMQF